MFFLLGYVIKMINNNNYFFSTLFNLISKPSQSQHSHSYLNPKYDIRNISNTYTFPTSDETAMTQNIEELVGGKTPMEVFSLFFIDEVWEQIVRFSNNYACDHNPHLFTLTVAELKTFCTLLLTGYHSFPAAKFTGQKMKTKINRL